MFQKVKATLNRDLRQRFGVRAFPVVVGDIVRIKSGRKKGEGGKVIEVDHVNGTVSIEGITVAKDDGKQKAVFLKSSDIVITKLDFSRQERIERLRSIAAIKKISIVEPQPEEVDAEAREVEESDTLENSDEGTQEKVEALEETTEEPDESEGEESDDK